MPRTIDRAKLREGLDVYASDGSHIGTVDEVGGTYVLVQKGLIFRKDVYVPYSAIDRFDENSLWLDVSKDAIDSRGWDAPPTADMPGSGTADMGTSTTGAATTTDAARIPLHEEELEARKTTRQAGEVNVRKNVVEEERTMDVPVEREDVYVRRTPVDRPATDAETSFAEGSDTIRVPVMEEDVELTKRPKVKEEIEIGKVTRQETERVGGTVRHEEVEVSGDDEPLR
jgi:uncharacterized protein (TIGR02271 family)